MRATGWILVAVFVASCVHAQDTETSATEGESKLPQSIEEQLDALKVSDLLRMMAEAEASLDRNGRQLIKAESDAVRILEAAQKTMERYDQNDQGFKDSVDKTITFWQTSQAQIAEVLEIENDQQLDAAFLKLLKEHEISEEGFRDFVIYVESKAAIPRVNKVRNAFRDARRGHIPQLPETRPQWESPLSGIAQLENLAQQLQSNGGGPPPPPPERKRGFRSLLERLNAVKF